MTEQSPRTRIGYTAAVVTFRRPQSLNHVLASLVNQTVPPTYVVVVDNDPECSAQSVVAAVSEATSIEVLYVAAGQNLGPAGGWFRAATHAIESPNRGEWLLVVDDDDPLGHPDLISRLLDVATSLALEGRLGALGLRGARLSRTARLHRCHSPEGVPIHADYLASNGAAIYSWASISEVGFFDPQFFFGFEDLDLGIRLTNANWQVYVYPLDSLHPVSNTSPVRVAWREYYKTRALVWIVRRRLGWIELTATIARSVVAGGLLLGLRKRQPSLASARLTGAYDALTDRMGARRYFPEVNSPKADTDLSVRPPER